MISMLTYQTHYQIFPLFFNKASLVIKNKPPCLAKDLHDGSISLLNLKSMLKTYLFRS